MNCDQFEVFRIILIISTIILRILLMPWYLQAYLNMAYDRFEQLKNQSRKISSIDHVQKSVSFRDHII